MQLNSIGNWRISVSATIQFLCVVLGAYVIGSQLISFRQPSALFPLHEKWTYDAAEPIVAVSISPEGVAIIRTPSKTIGIDSSTGQSLWSLPIAALSSAVPAQFTEGRLYLANNEKVLAVDTLSGKTLWSRSISSGSDARVLSVSSCCVVVNRASTDITVYSAKTGETKWSAFAGRGFVTAHIDENAVYLADNNIKALAIDTGAALWEEATGTVGDSAYKNGVIYLRSDKVVALNAHNKTILWSTSLAVSSSSEIASTGDVIVVGEGVRVIALDPQSGSRIWTASIAGGYNFTYFSDAVYVVDDSANRVIAVSPKTGELIGYLQLGLPRLITVRHDNMAAGNGQLIIAHGNNVYAYVLR